MAKYFPRQLLYRLRNEIPLQRLIVDHLNWPHHRRDHRFCFLCPSCNDFLTAINPRTNLGRCFQCEQNFNTIDLVMLITRCDFVQAVEFLSDLLPPSAPPASPSPSTPPKTDPAVLKM